ncbi:Uncharacterised protein [Streptococcus pneumoniae]|nr:Uncharacterised protein [Streptococcus pneumoniae]CJG02337.1 Uncharacterised protein [Streptococcus pneumoniae]CKE42775.1 Uncharacterised protein [Streptococcus pneumoniae]COL58857.1 Uncharacterised protein [Streptococcus pneumoniae]COS98183.1 Uncharacterised protein [Streptococcus pneumoniae]
MVPTGIGSRNDTFVAVTVPLFCIRTVYVNVSPTPASVALTLFITFNPEEFTIVITVLLGTVTVIGGSVGFTRKSPVTFALFTTLFPWGISSINTSNVTITLAPVGKLFNGNPSSGSAPSCKTPFTTTLFSINNVPWGIESWKNTFVAGTLPAFMTSIVYTKISPTVATSVLTAFTTSKFPDCTVVFTTLLGTLIVTGGSFGFT